MPAPQELIDQVISLDGKGYKTYKNLQGKSFSFGPFQLTFEHVQGDPFAAPSRLSIKIGLKTAGFAKTHNELLDSLKIPIHIMHVYSKEKVWSRMKK